MKAKHLLFAPVLWLGLGCGLLASQGVSALAVHVERNPAGTRLVNGELELTVTKEGVVSATILRDGKSTPILVDGRSGVYFGDQNLLDALTPQLTAEEIHDPLGNGMAVQLVYHLPGGEAKAVYSLYEQGDYFTSELFVTATGDKPLAFRSLNPLAGQLNLGVGEIRCALHEQMWDAKVCGLGKPRTGNFFAGLYNQQSHAAAVLGALTAAAESKVRVQSTNGPMKFDLLAAYDGPGSGELRVAPGQTARSGAYALFLPNRIFDGLEAYGAAIKKYNGLRSYQPIPCGWCSWDAYGSGVSERNILDTIALIRKLRLTEYGFNVVQIDDGWQCGYRRSGDWRPNRRFADGIAPLAKAARKAGLTLGLWIGPFSDEDMNDSGGPDGQIKPERLRQAGWLANHVPVLVNHPEFMGHDEQGRVNGPYDLSLPGFRQFLTDTQREFTRDWGVGYVKADFLAWNYEVQSDRSLPHHDVFRNALKAMREGMAPGTYFMTCISHEWKSLGIADAQRIGNDVEGQWNGLEPTLRCAGPLYWANGNLWWNDPDQLHLGGSVDSAGKLRGVTLDQARAWAALVALYGSITLTGDRLNDLSPERVKLLTQCLPATGITARPLDLFEILSGTSPERHASVWALKITKPYGDYHVVGLFNWTTNGTAVRKLNLADLQCKPGQRLCIFDFWSGKLLPAKSGTEMLDVGVAASSCRLLVLRPDTGAPQFLSSDRHLTAGGVDVTETKYDPNKALLSGRSEALVPGVPFTYSFYVPAGMSVESAGFDGQAENVGRTDDQVAQVTFTPRNPQISWSVQFKTPLQSLSR